MTWTKRELTIIELRELCDSDAFDIQIDTPDGWCNLGRWWDKGELPLVQITTEQGLVTRCATNHLLQSTTGMWMLADDLIIGSRLLTKNGSECVIDIKILPPEQCFDFEITHPNHRYWADGFSSHNSGKSYLASGNLVKHAQEMGILVVVIDTENALDESWMKALGVDTTKIERATATYVDDVAFIINKFMVWYLDIYKDTPREERQKVLFVIDSLSMLMTPTEVEQFQRGDMKGDMGRLPKQLKALVKNCVNMFAQHDIGMVCTNHVYGSQDMFSPDDKISGGSGIIYAASIVISMERRKLKEDEDGNKIKEVRGIRSAIKVVKSRFAKPFEEVEIKIPWETGMDPYSGLVEMFENRGMFVKDGNMLKYIDRAGEEHKYFKKHIPNELLDKMMAEFEYQEAKTLEE